MRLALLLLVGLVLQAAEAVGTAPVAIPLPPGLPVSALWQVRCADVPVPVLEVATLRGGPSGLARVLAVGALRLVVMGPALASPCILPPHPGTAVARAADGTLIIDLPGPGTWTLGDARVPDLALHLGVDAPTEPPPGIPARLYFGPGLHEIDTIDLADGETLWLDPSAVLRPRLPSAGERPQQDKDWAGMTAWRPFIRARGARRVAIRGGGLIDLSPLPWHARMCAEFSDCAGIEIDGLTIIDAPTWGVALFRCRDVAIRRVRNLSRRENSDGIDLCNTRDALVEDCFLRTNDDGVCVKTTEPAPAPPSSAITVRRVTVWNERARALGITSETRHDIADVRFSDCDIIRDFSAGGECAALGVLVADRGRMSGIAFERIRIHHGVDTQALVWIKADAWSHDDRRGSIDGVAFRDVELAAGITPHNRAEGFSAAHAVRGLAFSGWRQGGRELALSDLGLLAGPFVELSR